MAISSSTLARACSTSQIARISQCTGATVGGVDGQISNCILIINTVSVDLLLLLLYTLDAHEEALAENCKERDMSNMAREPCVKANNGVRRAKFVI